MTDILDGMEAVTWADLSDRARNALGGCRTVMAVVRIVEPPSGQIRGEAREANLDVRFAQPDHWRVERDGELVLLRDGLRHLVRGKAGAMQSRRRETAWRSSEEIGWLGWGHPDLFLDPPAFQIAVAGPAPVTVAGRDAWEVLLAAPGSKPYSLRVAVDDQTGLVLRHVAEGTPYIAQVLEIAVNAELPADTFSWDGETEERRDVDIQRVHAKHAAGLPLPRFWPAEPSWTVERVDEATGAFQARLRSGFGDAVLVRHPVEAPGTWDVDGLPHRHEWVHDRWQWTLWVAEPMSDDDLTRVRDSIA